MKTPKKSLEQVPLEEEAMGQESTALSDEEELDVDVLEAMGRKLLNDAGGMQALETGLSGTKDPGRVLGTFMSQMAIGMMQNIPQELNVSPRAYLAQGGFVDRMLDEIASRYNLPEEVKGQAFNTTIETMKAAVQSGQRGEQQQGQPQAAPPQQAAPMGPV